MAIALVWLWVSFVGGWELNISCSEFSSCLRSKGLGGFMRVNSRPVGMDAEYCQIISVEFDLLLFILKDPLVAIEFEWVGRGTIHHVFQSSATKVCP